MKRHRHHQRKAVKRPQTPSALAWILLTASWMLAAGFAAYLFRPAAIASAEEAEPAALSFAEQISAPQEEPVSISAAVTHLQPIDSLRSDKPTILIYHTHTTEAYTQTEQDVYRESSRWRTTDPMQNVVAVGETLKEILERDYGFTVIHDTTDHEPPKLATAYERSLVTMERYHSEYPSIVLFIDLHRDAYQTDNAPCDYLTVDGTETARLMLVVGKGEKYSDKPYYDSNIAFAERITDHLNGIAPNLCRPVRIKPGRYNQHVAPNCILVEVGHNANTLAQAKASMRYFAESIAYAFKTQEIKTSDWVPN